MLTDRSRRISVCKFTNRKLRRENGDWNPSRILSSPTPSSSSSSSAAAFSGGGYIEHHVTKYDTLAGIAIKYGVEVSDVTKVNGLVTDLQMFALKSLRIPLPGRHPPSPCLSNASLNHGEDCSAQASSLASNCNIENAFDSFHSLRLKPSETNVSPAMNSLQGYYGLKPRNTRASEGFEMTVYKKEDDQYLTPFPATNTPLNHHRKSRSLVDAVIAEVNQSSNLSKAGVELTNCDKPVKRRQKSEADFISPTPELLMKEENRKSSSGGFSTIAGKGLALRSKAASRTNLLADTETGYADSFLINLMDCVRKSFSASSLQEPNGNSNNKGSLLWPTSKWCLTPELITQAAITSSIFDGFPKPLTSWRNKKAVD